ncbi:YunC family protein [Gracilibacillus sp. HCP3S3_G5_1]|uniref:YunC family protein n=1 Tax=unclassified Gracilibacillus TaxID=2625209 RepID=UPI003F8BE944
MMEMKPIFIKNHPFTAISVKLPYTNLLVIANDVGYVMCGALDVELLNDRLTDRPIVAGRAVGVKTIEELQKAKLDKVTNYSKNYGWEEGMMIEEALLKIANKKG